MLRKDPPQDLRCPHISESRLQKRTQNAALHRSDSEVNVF